MNQSLVAQLQLTKGRILLRTLNDDETADRYGSIVIPDHLVDRQKHANYVVVRLAEGLNEARNLRGDPEILPGSRVLVHRQGVTPMRLDNREYYWTKESYIIAILTQQKE